MRRPAAVVLFGLVLSSCSLRADERAATMKIARFHALLNAGDFDHIIAEADPKFQWPVRGPTFKDYLAAVHRKLGFCGSWTMISFVENVMNNGRTARINTHIHCDRDDAEESFLFSTGTDMKLRGYLITSRLLVAS